MLAKKLYFYFLTKTNGMETTWGSITSQEQWYTVEHTLFTYSEDEIEENRINRMNANLILNPQFIPVYPEMIREWYSYLECIIYWFIKFFLHNNDKFYCSNEQLWEMLWVSDKTISIAVKKLKDNWLIDITYKIKANGGKVRFIKNVISDFTKMYSPTLQKCKGIENKIIENKIIYYSFQDFRKDYPHARKWKKADSEKYFLTQNAEDVKKQVAILKRKIKAWLQDAQYIPACERRIRDFTPISEDVLKQDLMRICKWHLNCGGDIKQRAIELKQTFGEEKINEIVKAIQQKPTLSFN